MVDVAAGHGYEFTKAELGRYLESKDTGQVSQIQTGEWQSIFVDNHGPCGSES